MTMDAERWARVQSLFHDAAILPPEDHRQFLEQNAGNDASLVADVLAMLRADRSGASLLDRGLAATANSLLHDSHGLSAPREGFGPYRLTRLLGEGGMGVVYLGEREDLDSVAAIKILRDAWLSPSRRDRFLAEQRTLAQLSHPGIAHLFDAGALSDGTPWIAMEYVEGRSLTAYCGAHTVSLGERLRLVRSVCEAVQHAHSHLVVHRDIKPSNILVTADGSVKLLDFGIAKQLDAMSAPGDATQTGLRLMTPAYAPPEQLMGGQVGIHSDVYALGVVLYELLAGRLPFDLAGKSAAEAAAIIDSHVPARPSVAATASGVTCSADEWADLDVLCLTAMHRDPGQRYRTCDALIRDIDHFVLGEPLEARPDALSYRLRKFAQRKRQPLAIAAAVIIAAVSLVAWYTVRLTEARNAAVLETARTERIQRFMLNLLQGGDSEVGPADSLRVLTVIEQGAQEARSLDGEPAVQAELYQTLGGVFQKLGQLDRADTLLSAALQHRRSLYGNAHPDVARSLVALGMLRVDQTRIADGEALVRQGVEMTKLFRAADHPDVADGLTSLGRVLEARGKFDDAIPVLEEAVRLQEARGAQTANVAKGLLALADNHFYAGHYDTAESLYQRSLAITRQVQGEGHPLVADGLISLGAVQVQRGKYKEAERYHRAGLAIIERWYGADDPRTASALTMLARSLVYEGRTSDAMPLLQRALATQERVYGKVHPKVASALNELGNVSVGQEKYDDADAYFARMVDIYRQVYGDQHYLLGIALANRGSVAMSRKDNVRGEGFFRQALAVYAKSLAPNHLDVAITRVKLGRVLLRQSRFAEAERETRAGYGVLVAQTSPSASYIRAARKDLSIVYDSLGRPAEAARFRAELADSTVKTK